MIITIDATPNELNVLVDRLALRLAATLKPLFDLEAQAMAAIDDEIANLTSSVSAERNAVDSAVKLMNGITGRIDAAVAAALAAGATEAQLQAIRDESTALQAQTQDLANAVAAVPA